jgi:hypothetical protein
MADIKLGISGAETTLPQICWQSGGGPTLPVDVDKGVDVVIMSDGSARANCKPNFAGSWSFEWDGLEAAGLATLLGVMALNGRLVLINEYTDNVPHDVVVLAYGWALKATTAIRTKKYTFSLSLQGV